MFKTCNSCGHQWKSRADFLSDPEVKLTGYQTFFVNLKQGLFLFDHSCDTTLAIEADLLLDLYNGTFYRGRKPAKGRNCPGRCLNENILSPCSSECRCSFISEMLSILKTWDKTAV